MISIEGHPTDPLVELHRALDLAGVDVDVPSPALSTPLHFAINARASQIRSEGQASPGSGLRPGMAWIEVPLEHPDLWTELDRIAEVTAAMRRRRSSERPGGPPDWPEPVDGGILAYVFAGVRAEGDTDAFYIDFRTREPDHPELCMLVDPVCAMYFDIDTPMRFVDGWAPMNLGITMRGQPRRLILRVGTYASGDEAITVRVKFEVLHDTGSPCVRRFR